MFYAYHKRNTKVLQGQSVVNRFKSFQDLVILICVGKKEIIERPRSDASMEARFRHGIKN